MKTAILSLAIAAALALSAPDAGAACFADYKAKRLEEPLRLHYGVARIHGPCTAEAARQELTPRLARHGWALLSVMSVFDRSGLRGRRANAGSHFLRF